MKKTILKKLPLENKDIFEGLLVIIFFIILVIINGNYLLNQINSIPLALLLTLPLTGIIITGLYLVKYFFIENRRVY